MTTTENVFYAGGTKGPNARANGKGGFMARGWYYRMFSAPRAIAGPFSTQRKARKEWAVNGI